MSRVRRKSAAFSLVELIMVVAIIGVLSVVAGTAYRRYLDNGRTAEMLSMLGEFRAKEEAYRAEFSTYFSTAASEDPYAAGNMFPALQTVGEPIHKAAAPPAGHPWTFLQIRTLRPTLQCAYGVYAGPVGVGPGPGVGLGLIGANPPATWWYALGVCDNDGAGVPNVTLATTNASPTVVTTNEHR